MPLGYGSSRWLLISLDNSLNNSRIYLLSLLSLFLIFSVPFFLVLFSCQIHSIYNFILITSILLFISLYYHYNRFFIFFSLIVTFYRTHLILILHSGTYLLLPSLFEYSTFYNPLAPGGVLPRLSS